MTQRDIKFVSGPEGASPSKKEYTLYSRNGETTKLWELPKALGSDPKYVAYSVDIESESNGEVLKRKENYIAFNGELVNPKDLKSSRNKMFKKVGDKCFASYIKYLTTGITTDYDRAVRHFGQSQ